MSSLDIFRVRLVWLASRTTYEAMYYYRAQKYGLNPFQALYGDKATDWLGAVARIAMEATRRIAESGAKP
jgi:hypothetical protein